ncbi:hypothetical protein C4K23_2553 [Pseudomonas chlororaphis]|nr:hypothetical protein C4K23_2553 [Pseudomonas chlororaphis]
MQMELALNLRRTNPVKKIRAVKLAVILHFASAGMYCNATALHAVPAVQLQQ